MSKALLFAGLLTASQPAWAEADKALLAIDAARARPLDAAIADLERWRPHFDAADTESRRLFLQLCAEIEIEQGHLRQAETTLAQLSAQSDAAGRAIAAALASQLFLLHGQTAESLREAKSAAELANAQTGPRIQAFAWGVLAQTLQRLGRLEEAMVVAQSSLTKLGNTAPARDRARFTRVLAGVNFELRDMPRALAYAQETKKLVEQDRDLWFMPTAELLLASVFSGSGRSNDSRQMLVHAIGDGQRLGLAMQTWAAHTNLADWYLQKARWADAAFYARHAIALSHKMDDNVQKGVTHSNLGQALIGLGQLHEGILELERSVEIANRANDITALIDTLPDLAAGYYKAGRVEAAYLALQRYRAKTRELALLNRERLEVEMQARFDISRRDRQIEQLLSQNQIQSATVERQRAEVQARGAAVLVLVAAVVFALLLFRRTRRSKLALEQANKRLAYFAERDPLSGLLNRRAMLAWLEQARAGAANSALGLLLLDIDHFKSINDRFGHAAGDAVIVELARRLQELLREDDRLARWGGEEFLIVVREIRPGHLEALAERILGRIGDEPFALAAGAFSVSLSAGFAAYPLASESAAAGWEAHLVLADQALFLAKRRGRNRACGVVELLRPWPEARRALEADFPQALAARFVRSVWCEGPELGNREAGNLFAEPRREARVQDKA